EAEEREVRALLERRRGAGATQMILLAAALEPLVATVGAAKRTPKPRDGAGEVAELVAETGAHRDEVLAETFATAPPAPGARAVADEDEEQPTRPMKQGVASDLEDLGDEEAPTARRVENPELSALRAKVAAAEARAKKELEESRLEAERWEQRKTLAEA